MGVKTLIENKTEITKNPRKVKNILILIDSSWGEIDWILPVCQYIKDNYTEITQTVLFNHLDSDAILKGNTFLKNLLSNCVDRWYETKDLLNPIHKQIFNISMKFYNKTFRPAITPYQENRLFEWFFKIFPLNKEIMKKIKPDVLLKDPSKDKGTRKHIIDLARETGVREIMFPHATCIYNIPISQKSRSHETPNRLEDDILCNSKEMTQFYSRGKKTFKTKIHAIGIPRYDEWWIKFIQNNWVKYSSKKKIYDSKKSIFLLFTVRPTSSSFTKETLGITIHEIVDTVFSIPDSFLIIKPHPRQDLIHLKNLLERYDKNKWTIDQSQAMSLSSISDIVIYIGRGSAVLDALAVGKPTILYKDANLKNLVDDYFLVGFSPRANDPVELKKWIMRFKSNPEKERKIFVDNFNKYLSRIKDSATRKTVNVILGIED